MTVNRETSVAFLVIVAVLVAATQVKGGDGFLTGEPSSPIPEDMVDDVTVVDMAIVDGTTGKECYEKAWNALEFPEYSVYNIWVEELGEDRCVIAATEVETGEEASDLHENAEGGDK